MLEQILTNEMVTTAIIGLVAAAITAAMTFMAVKIRSWVKDTERADKINNLVADAVWSTYEGFVKHWKAAAADGKLTAEEKAEAKRYAMSLLKEKGKATGLDVVKEVGLEGMSRLIESGVQAMKNGSVKATPATAPTIDVASLPTPPRTRRPITSAARMIGFLILASVALTGCPKDDPKPTPPAYDPTNGTTPTPIATETEFVPPPVAVETFQ
jgi:hypothetical protein